MPTPQSKAKQEAALRAANRKAVDRIRKQVLDTVEALWLASPDYRDEDIDKLVARLVPIIQAGELSMARLTSVYLARQSVLLHGGTYSPAAVDAKEINNLRKVPAREVYRRPAHTLYTALAAGKTLEAAKAEGLHRLMKMAATNLQMAKVHQANKSLTHSGAKYFRRRLSGNENCDLCEMATKHYYKTGDLAPIHDDCDCDVEEMHTREAMAKKAENARIKAAKIYSATQAETVIKGGRIRAVDGTSRAAVFEDLAVSNHGETGPTLHWQQHKFAGPK